MRIPLVPWLQTYRQLVEMELEELRRYTHTLEGALEEEGRRLKEDSEKQTSQMTEEQQMDFYEGTSDDFYRLGETFPRILRYSLFVNTYSLLEHTLLRIAEHLRDSQKLDLSPSDLRDKGITLANLPQEGSPSGVPRRRDRLGRHCGAKRDSEHHYSWGRIFSRRSSQEAED